MICTRRHCGWDAISRKPVKSGSCSIAPQWRLFQPVNSDCKRDQWDHQTRYQDCAELLSIYDSPIAFTVKGCACARIYTVSPKLAEKVVMTDTTKEQEQNNTEVSRRESIRTSWLRWRPLPARYQQRGEYRYCWKGNEHEANFERGVRIWNKRRSVIGVSARLGVSAEKVPGNNANFRIAFGHHCGTSGGISNTRRLCGWKAILRTSTNAGGA
jgi:hypothetical protein